MLQRTLLAGCAMLTSWLLNVALLMLRRMPASLVQGLSAHTGKIFLATYVLFAVPLVVSRGARWQLRFWYLLLAASLAWVTLGLYFLLPGSLPALFGPWPSQALPLWVYECSLSSVGLYLLLLRAAEARAQRAQTGASPL
ncbi:MAG TPA: hypothetical protein VGD62_08035 [Acidobacteriaceae bacterium]